MLKLAARGRDSASPEYAWGFWRRVTFLLTSTSSAGVAQTASDPSSPTSAESRPRCFRPETRTKLTLLDDGFSQALWMLITDGILSAIEVGIGTSARNIQPKCKRRPLRLSDAKGP
ncbi:hypothetical protein XH99_06955 [Bradyrhizobium nanningense]|uniref:Uncharacterized protein n=1 Tax=Bradyrhizobium nanningense TaxID=1325118 RepID=A0A4Q0SGC7_9BRAD|nr:hypothetical protein XH99_06955 [Bradyrhizobium nanningense]